jgi:Lysyl oxidase
MNRRLLTAGAVAVALVGAIAGVGVANAATDPPPFAFVAATRNVTAQRFVDGDDVSVWLDLGVNLIAGKEPFEIRTTRRSYADPIVAQQIVNKKGKTLPAGTVTGFSGLRDFTTITIKNKAGATVKSYKTDFCPNAYDSARARPDAPAASPYPSGCNGSNPFALGAVWGIQAGWNAEITSQPDTEDFDIPVGDYAVTVTINPQYASLFQIRNPKTTVNLKVEPYADPAGLVKAKARTAGAAAGVPVRAGAENGHGDHAGYLPGLRPPAKAPATLAAAPQVGPRPDLRALPAWGISLEKGTDEKTGRSTGKWYVNFGATVWNAGTSPLLVDGFRRTGTGLMDAYQYFFDAKGNQVGSVPAGTMQWDDREGHKHWHFTDFAQYNLLGADRKLAVRSGKEAFCLANTDAVDYTVANAKWRPENTDLSTACGGNTAVAVREVLDIGNGDTYNQARPGQSFEVTGLANGTYYIQVKANPADKLAELSTGNNTSLRKIVLGGTSTARTLTVPPVNGIDG